MCFHLSAEDQEAPRSDEDHDADWLDTERNSTGSSQTLTPCIQQSPTVSVTSACPGQLQAESSHTRLTHSPPAQSHSVDKKHLGGSEQHQKSGQEQRQEFLMDFEEKQRAAQQTMINEMIAFSTSFDEDPLQADGNKAEHSFLEWEEHLSALYDDHEDVEKESEENREQNVDNAATFNSALDELFQTETPVRSHNKVPSGSDLTGRTDATPERKPESPLISFTPQNTGQAAGFDLTGARSFTPLDKDPQQLAEGDKATDNRSSASGSDSSGISSSALASSVKATPSKKVTFSPDNSPRPCNGHGSELQDELPCEDELINTSGASLLDESFTPLQSGLFVQGGKSPGRGISQGFLAGGLFPQASSTSKATSLPNSADTDNLDENLAAQLSRLRKMAAEAFRKCEASGVGISSEGQEEEEDQADGDETRLPTTTQKPAVGEYQCRKSCYVTTATYGEIVLGLDDTAAVTNHFFILHFEFLF